MHRILHIVILFLLLSCKADQSSDSAAKIYITEDFGLVKSSKERTLLILFPGGASTSKEIKEEFNIMEKATSQGVSVLLMNFNRHLWIESEDSEGLHNIISKAIENYGIETNNIVMGGMSIGGNVALTLSNYLHQSKTTMLPKGVFIVDSPIDLYALYESSRKDISNLST